jgi:dUTP pyrophosphatase
MDKDAVVPFKSRASDSGYDLTLIKKIKTTGNVEWYDTGIKILPDFGWYFISVGRSSIAKSGYMLANSIGIIDRAYTGSIIVPLIKIDPTTPELTLPIRITQIIPVPIIHAQLVEVDSLEETSRGSSGWGSSGVK